MSMLATVNSTRLHAIASSITGSSKARAPVCTQVRHYAVGKKLKKADLKIKKDKNLVTDGNDSKKKAKRIAPFMPLSANSLRHSLFESKRKEVVLPVYGADTLTRDASGRVMQFARSEGGIISKYGVPTNILLEFRILSEPCAVVRDVTLSTVETLAAAELKSSRETRAVITGAAGSGKSYLLLQAVEFAHSRGWIVLYVPRAIDLVNSSTPYVYDPRTRTYGQPEFSYQLLQRFQKVNADAIANLKIGKEFTVGKRVLPVGTLLTDVVSLALRDHSFAPAALKTVFEEVARQTDRPVLLAVDDYQALYCSTNYRDQQFAGIKSYHLSIPRLLLEFASGKRYFERGAVLGALSGTHHHFQPPLELREALGIDNGEPYNPFARRSPELVGYAEGLRNIPVPNQMKVTEAASLFEVWAKDGALHTKPTDETFLSMYTSASGNPREFVWKGMLGSFAL